MLTGLSYVIQTEYPGYRFSMVKTKDKEIHIDCDPEFYLDVKKFIKTTEIEKKLNSYDMTEDIIITGTLYGEDIENNPLEIKGKRWAVDLIEFQGKVAGVTAMLMLANELGLELADYNTIGSNRFDTNSAVDFYLNKVNSKRHGISMFINAYEYGKLPINVSVFNGSNYSFTKEEIQLVADNNKYVINNSYAKGINVKPLRTLPKERFEVYHYDSNKYNEEDRKLVS